MKDYVFPNGNEQEFVEMAERLGIEELCLVYPLSKFKKTTIVSEIEISLGILAKEKEVQKAKNLSENIMYIRVSKNHLVPTMQNDRAGFSVQRAVGRTGCGLVCSHTVEFSKIRYVRQRESQRH